MNHKVRALLKRQNMLSKGDRVFVALSGGADSVALLHVLLELRGELGVSVRALHLNHKLRGEESERDERYVRALCEELGVPLRVGSAQVARAAKERGLSVEECARKARYAFFSRCAGGERDKVATAHTASDNAETVLLNLARGTSLRGLCGIPPVRAGIIRPLLDCTRREVEQYCAVRRLRYVTDSSNLSDDYTRNRLRHQVMPVLREINPRLEDSVARMARLLRADADWLDGAAAGAAAGLGRGDAHWDRAGFLALPAALRGRVLRDLLRRRGIGYDQARLELLERVIRWGRGAVQLSPRAELRCERDVFTLGAPRRGASPMPANPDESVQILVPELGQAVETGLMPGKRLRLTAMELANYKETINNCENPLKKALDYDRIDKILVLRHPKPSDRLRPVGRGCTKTFKNLWGESKIPPDLRRRQLLLQGAHGALWAEGFGPDEAAAPGRETQRVLLIETWEE